jgi:hypothetical protein
MIDPASAATLEQVFRRESLSLLRYVGDAFPWTTMRGGAALERLRGLVDAERDAVAAIGRYFQRHRIVLPPTGSYPSQFTTVNFVALSYLLPRLAAFERESIAALERDLAQVKDGDARQLLDTLVEVKRRNLAALEEMAAPPSSLSA